MKVLDLFLLIAFLCYSQGKCLSQELIVTDRQDFYNSNFKIFSECHLVDILPRYKRTLIEDLYRNDALTDLVLEMGKSSAYLLNEYIATGDTTILHNFPLFSEHDKAYWTQFRRYKLRSGKPIKLHGIDFERMALIPALTRAMVKTKKTDNDLFRYLKSLPDTIIYIGKYDQMRRERSEIIQKCISLYKRDSSYYNSIYDGGFVVKEMCSNGAIETEWNKRWSAMAHNLRLLYEGPFHKYLLIVGIYHVDCPEPIYKELERECQLKASDLVNIALVIKDCDVEAMYSGRGRVKLNSSKDLIAQTAVIDTLYTKYVAPCAYHVINVKSNFPDYHPGFKCDYILPIDCKFDNLKCN